MTTKEASRPLTNFPVSIEAGSAIQVVRTNKFGGFRCQFVLDPDLGTEQIGRVNISADLHFEKKTFLFGKLPCVQVHFILTFSQEVHRECSL